MRPKKLVAGLAATTALALPFVFASPAAAATLPTGDSLYAITCDDDAEGDLSASLYSVSPVDAVGTMVGDGTGIIEDCAREAAYNPVTGESFYISYALNSDALHKINTTTGVATEVGSWNGDILGIPHVIAIGKDGAAYIIDEGELFSLDLATANTTLIGDLGVEDIFGFSVDPTSGLFYATDNTGDAYRIDVAAATATFVGTVVGGTSLTFSLQIDTSGAWWVEWDNPGDPYTSAIWTGARPVDGNGSAFTLVGPLNDITNEYYPYTQALLITYPKALAATGVDATVLVGSAATAALLLLMGGSVFMLRRRQDA